ncbi:MAG TPA: NAD(+) synthase [Thermoanaerobaculaceae bacterium]|nr:NAD(+) synthase [Thermoanaerobaculaceae bacterium]HRS15525.1 NAD(+) synthase [Thermoanaerobaculaceae bacterium]
MRELPPVNLDLVAEALQRFLAEELRACGLQRYVLGLSGGIDSALAAALAVRAVGPDRLEALALPGPTSSRTSLENARLVADQLGIRLGVVDLAEAGRVTAAALGIGEDRLRFGNLMARLRMIALFDRARRAGALVLGTSNKSEILLGYSTLFGDSAASVQVLGDVWKTHIFQLGRRLALPRPVVEQPPSADLWPGQTDAGEMGFDYCDADPVLYWHHEGGMSHEALVEAGFAEPLVTAVLNAYRRNRFKWRPTVIARVSSSCINVDRILPRNPR